MIKKGNFNKSNSKKISYGFFNKLKINSKKKKNAFKDDLFVVNSEAKAINTKNKLDDIENENIILEAEKDLTDKKIINSKYKNDLSRVDMATDFNNQLAKNKKEQVVNHVAEGNSFEKWSTATAIVSAITTCVSLLYTNGDVYKKIFICISVIILCLASNKEIKTFDLFKNYFFERNLDGVMNALFKISIIAIYLAFSIQTNIEFWSHYFSGLSLWTFAIGFDLVSIEMASEAFKYKNLLYNKITKNDINKVFEEVEEEENKNNDTTKKPVAV